MEKGMVATFPMAVSASDVNQPNPLTRVNEACSKNSTQLILNPIDSLFDQWNTSEGQEGARRIKWTAGLIRFFSEV